MLRASCSRLRSRVFFFFSVSSTMGFNARSRSRTGDRPLESVSDCCCAVLNSRLELRDPSACGWVAGWRIDFRLKVCALSQCETHLDFPCLNVQRKAYLSVFYESHSHGDSASVNANRQFVARLALQYEGERGTAEKIHSLPFRPSQNIHSTPFPSLPSLYLSSSHLCFLLHTIHEQLCLSFLQLSCLPLL